MSVIILFLVVHWLADFVLQTDFQAKKKSTDSMQLTYHVATYSAVWFFISFALFQSWGYALLFTIITFICHWVTDYCTSRIVKRCFDTIDTHNGFVTIGFDQILHYVQLFVTYDWVVSIMLRKFADQTTLFYG